MTDLAKINENLFYPNGESSSSGEVGGDAKTTGSSTPATPPTPTTDDNANEVIVVDASLEEKRTQLANLRAELEKTEATRLEQVEEKEKDLENKRILLDKLSEEVASARRKIQGEGYGRFGGLRVA